jgi:chromosome segregation ATPase
MIPLLLLSATLLGQAEKPSPSPLTEEQVSRLRELVRATSETAKRLQAQLDEKQQQLARVYAQFELNERLATRLESEIVELQRQLLANHHKMQVELRTIVEKERFEVLRQRLSRALAPPKEPEPTRPAPPPPKERGQP